MIRNRTSGFSLMPRRASDMRRGTSATAISQPKAEAAAMISITMAVVLTALRVAVTNFDQFRLRYTKAAMTTV